MTRSEIPTGEVLAVTYGVRLAWDDPSHFAPEEKLPCVHGDGPTVMRDDAGDPCHIRCGEKELAARLYAERYGDLSPLGLAQELTGHSTEVRR
jgi:hypothetical protein